jgi:hypothetical protein
MRGSDLQDALEGFPGKGVFPTLFLALTPPGKGISLKWA